VLHRDEGSASCRHAFGILWAGMEPDAMAVLMEPLGDDERLMDVTRGLHRVDQHT
jgi:hypothetical protein